MKLEELEKECRKKSDPISGAALPYPAHKTISRMPKDASDDLCKVVRFIPDQTDPSGFRREESNEYIELHLDTGAKRSSPDAHLGGVELDIVDLRHAYPYSEDFTYEDWKGIR